jgi:hypothetical protein
MANTQFNKTTSRFSAQTVKSTTQNKALFNRGSHPEITRSVVYRHAAELCINVNNEIGLEPFLDYRLKEHLEDLASDGLTVVSVEGDVHRFSDGSIQILREVPESIDLAELDIETQILILQHAIRGLAKALEVELGV